MKKLIIKAFLTVAIFVALSRFIDLKQAEKTIQSLDLIWTGPLIPVLLGNLWLDSYRWRFLFPEGKKPKVATLVRYRLESAFASLFLPGTLGDDLYRIAAVKKYLGGPAQAASNVILSRVIGILALFPLTLLALVLAPRLLENGRLAWILVLFCCGGATLTLFLLFLPQVRVEQSASRGKLSRIRGLLVQVVNAIADHRDDRRGIAFSFAWTVAFHASSSLLAYFCMLMVTKDVKAAEFLAVFPVITVISFVPVGLSSFGTQEAGYVWLLSMVGIGTESALLASLLWNGVKVLIAASGGISLLGRDFGAKEAPDHIE